MIPASNERVPQLASRLGGHAEQIDLRAFLDELQQAHSVIYDYEYAQNIGPLIAGKQTEGANYGSDSRSWCAGVRS